MIRLDLISTPKVIYFTNVGQHMAFPIWFNTVRYLEQFGKFQNVCLWLLFWFIWNGWIRGSWQLFCNHCSSICFDFYERLKELMREKNWQQKEMTPMKLLWRSRASSHSVVSYQISRKSRGPLLIPSGQMIRWLIETSWRSLHGCFYGCRQLVADYIFCKPLPQAKNRTVH